MQVYQISIPALKGSRYTKGRYGYHHDHAGGPGLESR